MPFLPDFFSFFYSAFVSPHSPASPKISELLKYGGTHPGAYLLRRGLFMPKEIETILGREFTQEGLKRLTPLKLMDSILTPDPGNAYARVATLESSLYMQNQLLRDADWAGMAHSIEIRVPYVDSDLLKNIAPVLVHRPAARINKSLLAAALANSLPEKVLKHAKTGFLVPIDKWLQSESQFDGWKKIPILARHYCHWSRRWAYVVYEQSGIQIRKSFKRILVLLTDAFGGHGGIAKFNRDLLNALCA